MRHKRKRHTAPIAAVTRQGAGRIILRSDWPSSPHPLSYLPLQLLVAKEKRKTADLTKISAGD